MKQYWNKQKLDLVNKRQGQVRRGHFTTEITRTIVKWTAVSICEVTQHFVFAVFSGHKFVAMREVREAAVVVFLFLFLHSFCLLFVNGVQKLQLLFFCFGKFFWLRQLDDFGHHHGGIKKFSHVVPLAILDLSPLLLLRQGPHKKRLAQTVGPNPNNLCRTQSQTKPFENVLS